jgi:hypothetical protein
MDLLATGERERLDAACEELARIGRTIDRQAPGAGPAGPRAAAV